ncbi:MAG: DNA double-strand break repair nuclease NurA [Anaerolineales bacterium]|nr:DNA double-strand break repair nuclease NurA [Anaerolineales bacterium]
MALDLSQLTQAVNALSANAAQRAAELEAQLPVARAILAALGPADDDLRRKIAKAGKRWPGAIPTAEAVGAAFPLPPHPARVNVLAADGSQIYPDRHGVALYYLINTGRIAFRHGSGQAPRVASRAEVFYEDADLYEPEGGQIAAVKIDAERDCRELGALAELAQTETDAPAVALVDNGLLLYLTLQAPNQKMVDELLGAYLTELDRLRATGAAAAGVVDRPRAANVVRLLQLATLELDEISDQALRDLGPFTHLTDGLVFHLLKPGERSALFVNASPANQDNYRPRGHTVYFFYLNAGRPGRDAVLRVEVPEWVAQDPAQLDLVHTAIVEQCRVTDGFPYVLMRAHELAVVTMAERREFEQMVVGGLLRRGLSPSVSQKAQGKAWTGSGSRRYP